MLLCAKFAAAAAAAASAAGIDMQGVGGITASVCEELRYNAVDCRCSRASFGGGVGKGTAGAVVADWSWSWSWLSSTANVKPQNKQKMGEQRGIWTRSKGVMWMEVKGGGGGSNARTHKWKMRETPRISKTLVYSATWFTYIMYAYAVRVRLLRKLTQTTPTRTGLGQSGLGQRRQNGGDVANNRIKYGWRPSVSVRMRICV